MITLSSTFSPATTSRVSSSLSPSKHFAVTLRLAGPPRKRRFACPCFSALPDVVKDKEASPASSFASAATAAGEEEEPRRSRSFFDAKTEEGGVLKKKKKKGRGMASSVLFSCHSSAAINGFKKSEESNPTSFLGNRSQILARITKSGNKNDKNKSSRKFRVYAVTKGSAEPSESEETMPSWAKPGTDEPPPWAREDGKTDASKEGFEVPFFVYLLSSAVTAIASIGSIFEYANQRPVFGVVLPESVFYAPLLGFFIIGGIPTSAFLWFKSVRVANKEAEDQDRRDGYL